MFGLIAGRVVGWFFNTKIGQIVGFALIFLAVLGWVYFSGRREGAADMAAKQTEQTLDKLRRMRDANASTSRNRSDVVNRMRDGKF